MTTVLIILCGVLLVAALIVAIPFGMFFKLWLQTKASSVPLSLVDMVFMRLRKVDPYAVAPPLISMYKAGFYPTVDEVESHVLCGGNLEAAAEALIRAGKADIDIDFRKVAAIDLAGRDVVDAVDTHVNPKVLVCPSAEADYDTATGVAGDGVRVRAPERRR